MLVLAEIHVHPTKRKRKKRKSGGHAFILYLTCVAASEVFACHHGMFHTHELVFVQSWGFGGAR